jgi:uncharacterized 2Fe-2S/4Fe-4S cluster protein (DUF4445 family)
MPERKTDEIRCTVRLTADGGVIEKSAAAGSSLYDLMKAAGLSVAAPCGGNGTCGKCLVRITDGAGVPYTEKQSESEKRLLGDERLAMGWRLACRIEVNDGMEVRLPESSAEMRILSQGKRSGGKLRPIAGKTVLRIEEPSHDDQTPDMERVRKAWERHTSQEPSLQNTQVELSPDGLRGLRAAMRAYDYRVTLVCVNERVAAVEPGDTSEILFGVAFDIGTTTIAGYLVDLNTGHEEGIYAAVNPQRIYGADVISRISYTLDDPEKLAEMHRAIVDEINASVEMLAKRAHISVGDIYAVTFAGNTTMMHFLMNLPADGIALAPFIPVTTDMECLKAGDLGIRIHENGLAVVFPAVSAYVGADTVAAVLSTGMYREECVSLLIDIGTNGEIVLGNRSGMLACSAAAGPAFEGAGIRNGVSSVRGAIDKLRLLPELRFTTIGDAPAVGLCGSGIVDAVAEMLAAGIIDGSGKFVAGPDAVSPALRERIIKIGGQNAFLLAGRIECDAGTDIAVTQKDVRELQNAKAAIAAGIRILLREAGIRPEDVEKVYLAGGFGSYINISNAIKIGLLPKELAGRIEAVGNASGAGAVEGLLSREALCETKTIKSLIRYIELSYSGAFLKEYMACMKLDAAAADLNP